MLDLDGSKVYFDATSPAQRKMEEADAPVSSNLIHLKVPSFKDFLVHLEK